MSQFFKNKHLIFLSILITLFFAGVYSASARTATIRAEEAKKERALTITGSLQKMLTMRIAQYQAFASTSLASLPKADREVLNTEILASIARMQKTLDDISSTSTSTSTKVKSDSKMIPPHVSLTQEDTILNMKMNILVNAFKPSAKEMRASFVRSMSTTTSTTTKKAEKNSLLKQQSVATSSASIDIPKKTTPLVFSKTSFVKASLIHQVITATTIQDVQAVQAAISGKVLPKKVVVEKKTVVPKKKVVVEPEIIEKTIEASSTQMITETIGDDSVSTTTVETVETNSSGDQATTTPDTSGTQNSGEPAAATTTTESVIPPEVPVTDITTTSSSSPETN
ncbi:MAG: hypothetical protein PHG25_02180 [Candidatus Pacebacteria bacterium]|nr:hypothetical protein [Candidatus Paceibacterota bacterium]